ncbi:MAG: hypothetical protein KF862_27770 [Chitinophagaceae bacterium]|nr:hypothetical protein [Chitinophagaceae bacterium]
MQIVSKPYHLLLITSVVLVLISLLSGGGSLDIHLTGSRHVLDGIFILRSLAMLLLLNWILYRVTQQFLLTGALTWMHIIVTLILVTGIVVFIFMKGTVHPKRYFDYSYTPVHAISWRSIVDFIPAFIILVLLTQLLFIINLFLGLLKRVN